ncbi:hypothetical protein HZH68_000629 [Vespula germanica]|uniref:Uncharacterized protein n=1 Tax=Vespula germanica TaxID=30212 RepID=A0A834U610_VESGE|nr:hypothetical protein HZH68_000629 [Vespula germanica]
MRRVKRLNPARERLEKDPLATSIGKNAGGISTPMGHLVLPRSTCHASAPSRYFCCLRRSYGENKPKATWPPLPNQHEVSKVYISCLINKFTSSMDDTTENIYVKPRSPMSFNSAELPFKFNLKFTTGPSSVLVNRIQDYSYLTSAST